MGKSDEITKRLIAGETEEQLVKSGFKKASVRREQNKIKLILDLTKTANAQMSHDLNLRKLLIYAHHSAVEISWGTLVGIFGLAVAFNAELHPGTALFLAIAGVFMFDYSLYYLNREIESIDPITEKVPWGIILVLALTGPPGLLLVINGIGGISGLTYLELLKGVITYSASSKGCQIMTVLVGLVLLVIYFWLYNHFEKKTQKSRTNRILRNAKCPNEVEKPNK
jgi:hypothetical protein